MGRLPLLTATAILLALTGCSGGSDADDADQADQADADCIDATDYAATQDITYPNDNTDAAEACLE